MSKFNIEIETFKAIRSNTLFGIVAVIPELRLRISDLTVHQSNGRRWVGLPASPQVDKDGAARRNEKGKIAYTPVLQFLDPATADAFSNRVIEELLAAHPNAFADGDAA